MMTPAASSAKALPEEICSALSRWATTVNQCQGLLYNLLDVDPKTRYTAEQALNHRVSGRNCSQTATLLALAAGERRKDARTATIKARLDNIRSEMEKEGKEGKGRTRKTALRFERLGTARPLGARHDGRHQKSIRLKRVNVL